QGGAGRARRERRGGRRNLAGALLPPSPPVGGGGGSGGVGGRLQKVSTAVHPVPKDLVTATVRFCRLLRARGLGVTPGESRDAVRALELIDLGDRAEVHRALRTVLVTRPEDFATFDAAFDGFWGGRAGPGTARPPRREGRPPGGEAPLPEAQDARRGS